MCKEIRIYDKRDRYGMKIVEKGEMDEIESKIE